MPPLLCMCAALCVGLSKSGLPGISLLTVALMAEAFPPRESTGILLPLLIFGDLCAVHSFRKHTVWKEILRPLPATLLGIVAGFLLMRSLPEARFKPILGWLLLGTVLTQTARSIFPGLDASVPRTRPFAWFMGFWAGIATMVANAAGPIFGLYLLSLALPKEKMVGTSAWFFLIINVLKLPFSASLGLLHAPSLKLDLILCPLVLAGTLTGRRLLSQIPQKYFEKLLLLSAALAALKLAL
jgi:uncharacterized membrane protein YfcA